MSPPLHGGGQGFESPRLHSKNTLFCRKNIRNENRPKTYFVPLCSNVEGGMRRRLPAAFTISGPVTLLTYTLTLEVTDLVSAAKLD